VHGNAARPEPLRLQTAYDPERRTLKVVAIGAPGDVSAILRLVEALAEAWG